MTGETVRAQSSGDGEPVAERPPGRPQDGNENGVCEAARPSEQQVLLQTESERNEGTGEKKPTNGGSCCLFLSCAPSSLFAQWCFCNKF